jgi:hypothetical protein
MFQLSENEVKKVSQLVIPPREKPAGKQASNSSRIVMSSSKHRGKRYRHHAFTEQGVAMLSSFLKLERRVGKHDKEIASIFEAIRELMGPPEKPGREVGFHVREEAARYRGHKRA